jgi:uncharacterized membrane protein YphA (DoxX/SURF4 family)
MTRRYRDVFVMFLAWPLGVALAVAWLFIPKPWDPGCPTGQACELQPTSLLATVAWLCLALGPGIWATARWWRGVPPAP